MSTKMGIAKQYDKKFTKCLDDIYEYLSYFNSCSATKPGCFETYISAIEEVRFKLDICETVKDYNKVISLEALMNECEIWDR